ncbi:MAG: glycosyltransferase family 39 protein [Acidobacteria bacterium]|nr:glycosyltransferase family 39 protein [Acidobacteriota bacterium]
MDQRDNGTIENNGTDGKSLEKFSPSFRNLSFLLLIGCSLVFFIVTVISPPYLMDDVDSVTAQIARNMIESGDWVTPRLNGIAYFEKPALRFWVVAGSYLLFGIHDWAARIPIALAAVALCWLLRGMGIWAFSANSDNAGNAGNLAGMVLATSVGLFLFTRILIPDVILTLSTTLAMWSLLRALDREERRARLWSALFALSMGLGFMLKGLVAFVFPIGTGLVYLLATRQFLRRQTWQRIRPVFAVLIIILICLPWVTLAILRNPPYFDFNMKSEGGHYRGFFWFFFLNEHLFRYLNLRYPRDYNTVPRVWFWLLHLLWLFPWSVWLGSIARLNFKPVDRPGRVSLFCLCWIGFTLIFFSFSTTQEYYSMPSYPAFALLIGAGMSTAESGFKWPARVAGTLAILAAIACSVILWLTRDIVASGDIAGALREGVSTLSLGQTGNLTLKSFAWLRIPLAIALCAFLVGAAGAWWKAGRYAVKSLSLMMIIFFIAARMAMVTLNPYFGSRLLAESLNTSPPGKLIIDEQYYYFSSVFFYANRRALLLNGRVMNLEYGSYAPEAPQVFISDRDLPALWAKSERYYLVASNSAIPRLKALLGNENLYLIRTSGGKFLMTNQALAGSRRLTEFELESNEN